MDINAAIIDQHLTALVGEIEKDAKERLRIIDDNKLKSLAFVYLSVKTVLDLSYEETFECLTEGGDDFGVDAVHISEKSDNEFTVTLFQGKYKQKLEGTSHFPENGIKSLIYAIRYLFDPSLKIENINKQLELRIAEIQSLIRDGYIPQVRVIACSNGQSWNESTDQEIERAKLGKQVTFEYCNHDNLVSLLQKTKPVNDSLQFSGKAIVEDFNFSRVLIGRIAVNEIASLISRHGDRLLERNIRRYLGLKGNRVNEAIATTLQGNDNVNFYFYNNGITLTCNKFDYNALQSGDYQVKISNLQIINGGQTCMTIYKSLLGENSKEAASYSNAFVLVRLYQLSNESDDTIQRITFATNSQNPVDLKDLHANDEIQKRLETDIKQLGYSYHRKRSDSSLKSTDISIGVAAEAVLSVWRRKPHQTKFFSREHFGKLYADIFTNDLSGAQVIVAVLLYRVAENYRKRPPENAPVFLSYASHFIAMQMGKALLSELNLDNVAKLNHINFTNAVELIEQKGEIFFHKALDEIEAALQYLYGIKYHKKISLQQLSATFRRGDLIDLLDTI